MTCSIIPSSFKEFGVKHFLGYLINNIIKLFFWSIQFVLLIRSYIEHTVDLNEWNSFLDGGELNLKEANNDQDKLKYNIDVKFGHIIKMKRSLECNSVQEWNIMIDPNFSMVVIFTNLCYCQKYFLVYIWTDN